MTEFEKGLKRIWVIVSELVLALIAIIFGTLVIASLHFFSALKLQRYIILYSQQHNIDSSVIRS